MEVYERQSSKTDARIKCQKQHQRNVFSVFDKMLYNGKLNSKTPDEKKTETVLNVDGSNAEQLWNSRTIL